MHPPVKEHLHCCHFLVLVTNNVAITLLLLICFLYHYIINIQLMITGRKQQFWFHAIGSYALQMTIWIFERVRISDPHK